VRTSFRTSFLRDLKAIRERQLLLRVKDVIEAVENAETLANLQNLKPIKGAKNYFRIRLGEHRLGLCLEGDTVTFVRFLHRREIYRYFP
jgi:mRNA interferase RelE/StbE